VIHDPMLDFFKGVRVHIPWAAIVEIYGWFLLFIALIGKAFIYFVYHE
jgi:hypothetical protein